MRLGDIAKKSSLKLKMISEEELVDLHKVLLLMLDDLIEICKRNNLHFILIGGSAIGALRDKGFIPWDDDIDIAMPRRDFEKLYKIIKKQYSFKYSMLHPQDKENYGRILPKIRLKGTEYKTILEYDLNESGIFIDIYTIENIPDSKIKKWGQGIICMFMGFALSCRRMAKGYKIFKNYTLKRTSTYESYEKLVEISDAVYIRSNPILHYKQVKYALEKGKHVLCEAPIALKTEECRELFQLAKKNRCTLVEGIKTAYSTAYYRLVLLAKTGKIGEIISVDATCTSIKKHIPNIDIAWNSMSEWGPTALLPVFQILGTNYDKVEFTARFLDDERCFDTFSKASFIYPHAVASIKVGCGVKSEGELVISGTEGYIYVPAPWWKTDYFEVRFENSSNNKRYFYQLDGEGIRYELADFVKTIEKGKSSLYISEKVSEEISNIMEAFQVGNNLICI